jgi:hypothetical protein
MTDGTTAGAGHQRSRRSSEHRRTSRLPHRPRITVNQRWYRACPNTHQEDMHEEAAVGGPRGHGTTTGGGRRRATIGMRTWALLLPSLAGAMRMGVGCGQPMRQKPGAEQLADRDAEWFCGEGAVVPAPGQSGESTRRGSCAHYDDSSRPGWQPGGGQDSRRTSRHDAR